MSDKVVHIIPVSGADFAFCEYMIDYMHSRNENRTGWCVVDYISTYEVSAIGDPSPWVFCKDCLQSPDYALHLLGAA
jgi:hypothetical protein